MRCRGTLAHDQYMRTTAKAKTGPATASKEITNWYIITGGMRGSLPGIRRSLVANDAIRACSNVESGGFTRL